MDLSGPHSELIYMRVGSRVTLVHKSVLVITQVA